MGYDLGRPTLSMPDSEKIGVTGLFRNLRTLICEDQPSQDPFGKDPAAIFGARIKADTGSGSMDAVSFGEDFMLLAMRAQFFDTVEYRLASEGYTRFHFRTSAHTALLFDGIGQADLRGPLCQVLHQPTGVDDGEWIEGNVDLNWVTLFVKPEAIMKRFRFDSFDMPAAVDRLARGSDELVLENRSMAPGMAQAMADMFRCDYPSDLRRVYFEAKATELVCLLAQTLGADSGDGLPVKLSGRDHDALDNARHILVEQFMDPPSFIGLSRQLGINRNKLAYGFRHRFGMSVADFVLEQRMQKAHALLQDTGHHIGYIAHLVGYTQAASFSTAFKRRYGVSPRALRGR